MPFDMDQCRVKIAPVNDTAASFGLEERPRPGVAARVFSWMQQGICGLSGHDALLHWDRDRLYLRCASCGHETPGWDVARRPLRAVGEPRNPMHAELAVARKIA